MRDLTKGPVHGHVLQLSTFIALTTFFQTLYFLVDLYFVGRLGKEAIAGVGLSGTLAILVLALTQTLGVGATSLIAQSLGRKRRDQAERFFNQALVLSSVVGLAFGLIAFATRHAYSTWLSADAVTAAQSARYLDWFVPALVLQFPLVAMGAALRGMGDLKMPTLIQIVTVVINIVLAPTLMFGWVTGVPLNVAGASLASFIAIVIGCAAFVAYFARAASPMHVRVSQWSPDFGEWWHMLRVGLPVGGEFLLMSVYLNWSTTSSGRSAPPRRPDSGSACASCSRSSCRRSRLDLRPRPSPGRTSARGSARACARRSTRPRRSARPSWSR